MVVLLIWVGGLELTKQVATIGGDTKQEISRRTRWTIDKDGLRMFARKPVLGWGYLVASRFDTNKARYAAEIGVTVISESETIEFIQSGCFPRNQTPTRPSMKCPDFKTDEIVWMETYTPERLCLFEYCNNEGKSCGASCFSPARESGVTVMGIWVLSTKRHLI